MYNDVTRETNDDSDSDFDDRPGLPIELPIFQVLLRRVLFL